jgi:CRISPR system Cascade subunit CasD
MSYLVFQLQALLSSWGEPAVGGHRGTAEWPGQSALLGLLGAALGLDRADESAHARLRDGLGFAVGVLNTGTLLRDYHTAQVPPQNKLKGRPHATRQQELAVPKFDLKTILSTRDYRQNSSCLVALSIRQDAVAAYTLDQLAQALRTPTFVLYLGRKACVPGAPLWPQVLHAECALDAFSTYRQAYEAARQGADNMPYLEPMPELLRIVFDEHSHAGVQADLVVRRKDRMIRRTGWHFGDRQEHIHLLASKDSHVPE